MKNRYFSKIKSAFFTLVIIYFVLAAYYYISRSDLSGGDENLFIADLNFIKENGWFEAIKKNISIPYMILAYPLSLFMKYYIALRLVNITLLILFFLYLIRQNLKLPKSGYIYLAFFISASGYFYYGTNDTLFFLSLSVFLYEASKASIGKNYNLNFAISALLIAVFTRELSLVYFPVIILGLIIFYIKGISFSKNTLIPVFLLTGLLLINLPSLSTKGYLSYDRKLPPKSVTATWSQRQYLAQLKVNNKELEFQSHPTWKETDLYLKKYGEDSLPKSLFAGLTHDINLTVKEFFKDIFYVMIYHTRLLGLILLSILFFPTRKYYKTQRLNLELFIPVSVSIMIFIFSLIIISFVEMRWLAPVFILSILYYSHLEKNNKIPPYLLIFNMIILSLFAGYDSYNLITKIF